MATNITASQVGFCAVDANAGVIASNLVHRASEAAADLESTVNRLFRGRSTYTLSDGDLRELVNLASRFDYLARTARDVLSAQSDSRSAPFYKIAAE